MVRHGDHRRLTAEIAAEVTRRTRSPFGVFQVEDGQLGLPQQAQARRRLFHDCAQDRGAERGVIPGQEPAVDAARLDADGPHRCRQCLDRPMRKFCGVPLAGKTLFLVIADQSRPARGRDFDQRHSAIVRPRGADAAEIEGFAPFAFGPQRPKSLRGKRSARPKNAFAGVKPVEQRQRQRERCPAKTRIAGTNAHTRTEVSMSGSRCTPRADRIGEE